MTNGKINRSVKLEGMGIFTSFGKQNKSPEKLEELRAFGASLQ